MTKTFRDLITAEKTLGVYVKAYALVGFSKKSIGEAGETERGQKIGLQHFPIGGLLFASIR